MGKHGRHARITPEGMRERSKTLKGMTPEERRAEAEKRKIDEAVRKSQSPARKRKTRIEKVEEVLIQALDGENVDLLVKRGLSEDEQRLFYDLLTTIRSSADPEVLSDLWKVDYVRRPPTIQEFIEDPYWLGEVLVPSEKSKGLFPKWREILLADFDLDSRIHNVVLTGSLGIGKSFILSTIFLYKIALCTLLRRPQQFYGLSGGSKIFYVMLSLSKSVVAETVFGDVQNFMAQSPYFLEQCNFDPDKKYSDFRIGLGKSIYLTAGSKGWHIIGRNAMGVCLDEGNWRLEANPDQKAYKLYDEVATRIQNRFQKVSGFMPAISILASSARDESSFTEKVIKDIEEVKDEKTQKVYRYAVYDIRRDELKLTGKWFRVAYGLKSMDPSILSGWYDDERRPIADDKFPQEEAPAAASIVYVPEYYFAAFKRNTVTNLQSIAGISTGGSHRLMSSMVDVERCLELSFKDVVNPARMDHLPISMEDDKQIWDFLDHPRFLTRRNSIVCPIRHPDATRFAHIDLATQSMAGIGICHLVGSQRVDGLIKDGEIFSEYRLVVEFDFILTIVAGQVKPISMEKIQKFFFWLRDMCHYRFGLVTADQWQSAAPLQMLESRGFEVDNLSMDRDKTQYYALRSGFEEHRIRMYRQRQFLVELENLVDGEKKVDHPSSALNIAGTSPTEGSKDTSDGVAGAYYNAIVSAEGVQAAAEPPAMESGQAESTEEVELVTLHTSPPPTAPKVFKA